MNISALEVCRRDLYADESELRGRYPAATVEKVLRVREMHQWSVANTTSSDRDFVEECVRRFDVSTRSAYGVLHIVKELLPSLNENSKEYARWKYNEMILETYKLAKEAEDFKTMERAASSYAKYNRIDLEDEKKLPYDMIVLQPFVPTMDPTVLGLAPIPNLDAHVDALLKKYSADISDIEDIEYEEADLEEDTLFAPDKPTDPGIPE